MTNFEWQDSYSVGVSELDDQHRALFRIIRQLETAVARSTRHEVVGVFSQLMDYAHSHFSAEEQHMRATGYAEFEAHLAEHTAFAARIDVMWNAFLAQPDVVGPELLQYMQTWLVEHILDTDMRYARAAGVVETVETRPSKGDSYPGI